MSEDDFTDYRVDQSHLEPTLGYTLKTITVIILVVVVIATLAGLLVRSRNNQQLGGRSMQSMCSLMESATGLHSLQLDRDCQIAFYSCSPQVAESTIRICIDRQLSDIRTEPDPIIRQRFAVDLYEQMAEG